MLQKILTMIFITVLIAWPTLDVYAAKEEDMQNEISAQVSGGNCNATLGTSLSDLAQAAIDSRNSGDTPAQEGYWEALGALIEGSCNSSDLNSTGCAALSSKL